MVVRNTSLFLGGRVRRWGHGAIVAVRTAHGPLSRPDAHAAVSVGATTGVDVARRESAKARQNVADASSFLHTIRRAHALDPAASCRPIRIEAPVNSRARNAGSCRWIPSRSTHVTYLEDEFALRTQLVLPRAVTAHGPLVCSYAPALQKRTSVERQRASMLHRRAEPSAGSRRRPRLTMARLKRFPYGRLTARTGTIRGFLFGIDGRRAAHSLPRNSSAAP
jgi:hypothetical protein